ncbi:MAG: sce7726 family protein [Actinobacteria bacterium]|nr:sce7726 family protein [Actinomycetota bacterium]
MEKVSVCAPASDIGPVYARFFSSGVLRELAHKGHSTIAARLARQCHLFDQFGSEMAVGDFYDAIFKRLTRDYRHEYIYKNAIAEKILLGKHNLNTAFMLMEFRADDCIADAVVLNGTSHVYEIKSEMDSFDRLDRQLAAYQKMFDFITIITTERLYKVVNERIPKEVGIMVLADGRYQFRRNTCRREAISNKYNVDPIVIFNSLQRREYLRIIKKELGASLTHYPNTQIYGEAKKYFEQLTPELAHDAMVETLKNRSDTLRVADFVDVVPSSLKAAALSMRLTREERNRFIGLLHKGIASVFA